MSEHIFLPTIKLNQISILAEHKAWLEGWLQSIEQDIERGDVSASMCLQGVMSEILLYERVVTDWVGIMDGYLTRAGKPLAYSELYGKRLYQFAFWVQSEVHAIHARWWIERICNTHSDIDFPSLIESLIQPNGWIYDPVVSMTGIRTRMKSEYLMSLGMGIEILKAYERLENRKLGFESLLSSESLTGYLGAEYFRVFSLCQLDEPGLAPVALAPLLHACEIGEGYCDFDVRAKIDDYMGTAKRTNRDIPVHSALAALHAAFLAPFCEPEPQSHILERVKNFGTYIRDEPLDIQPFRMREIDIPFGTGLSPLEIIAASGIVHFSDQSRVV